MRTVVLDTNVLLADPGALLSYPDAEVIIPETVLGEIDKLKTTRVDPDLRFRGREVSRILFEFSEQGSLIDGVELPDGGILRVVPLESDVDLPGGLTTRNADDKILAVAYQVCASGCDELILVTNDLNMLLKAQTLGIPVERRAGDEGGFARKYIIRPFQRYRIPLTILAIAVAVFAGVIALSIYTSNLGDNGSTATVPAEFRDMLSTDQRALLDGLIALQRDPSDTDAMKSVANAYYNLRDQTGSVVFAQKAITYYGRYLQVVPDDLDVRTDLAAMYFYSGATDRAIQEATTVIQTDPAHVQANYNLGVFYWRGRSDYQNAAKQLVTVIDLTDQTGDPHDQIVNTDARTALGQLVTEAQEAGVMLEIDQKYLTTGGTI